MLNLSVERIPVILLRNNIQNILHFKENNLEIFFLIFFTIFCIYYYCFLLQDINVFYENDLIRNYFLLVQSDTISQSLGSWRASYICGLFLTCESNMKYRRYIPYVRTMRQERARIQRYASAFIWSLITRRALSPSVTGMARDLAITYFRAPTRLMRPSRTCAIVSWFMGHRVGRHRNREIVVDTPIVDQFVAIASYSSIAR